MPRIKRNNKKEVSSGVGNSQLKDISHSTALPLIKKSDASRGIIQANTRRWTTPRCLFARCGSARP